MGWTLVVPRRGGVQTWKLLDGGHLLSAAREWLRGSLVAANAARAFASRRSTRSSSVFAAMMQRLGSQLDSLPRNIARACRRRLRGSDLRLHVRVRARRRYRVLAPLVWALSCGASSLVVVVRFVQETMCAIVALAIVDAEHDAADAVGNAIRWWHDVQGRCVFTCLPLSPVVLVLCSRWLRGCLLMLLYAVRVCCVCVLCVYVVLRSAVRRLLDRWDRAHGDEDSSQPTPRAAAVVFGRLARRVSRVVVHTAAMTARCHVTGADISPSSTLPAALALMAGVSDRAAASVVAAVAADGVALDLTALACNNGRSFARSVPSIGDGDRVVAAAAGCVAWAQEYTSLIERRAGSIVAVVHDSPALGAVRNAVVAAAADLAAVPVESPDLATTSTPTDVALFVATLGASGDIAEHDSTTRPSPADTMADDSAVAALSASHARPHGAASAEPQLVPAVAAVSTWPAAVGSLVRHASGADAAEFLARNQQAQWPAVFQRLIALRATALLHNVFDVRARCGCVCGWALWGVWRVASLVVGHALTVCVCGWWLAAGDRPWL